MVLKNKLSKQTHDNVSVTIWALAIATSFPNLQRSKVFADFSNPASWQLKQEWCSFLTGGLEQQGGSQPVGAFGGLQEDTVEIDKLSSWNNCTCLRLEIEQYMSKLDVN